MKGNRLAILALFCVIVVAISVPVVASLTSMVRAIAVGVILSAATAALILPAATDRRAIARGIIAIGATAFSAPLAAVQAYQMDFIFGALDPDRAAAFEDFEQAMATGVTMIVVGLAVGTVMMIVGGLMHRRAKLSANPAP